MKNALICIFDGVKDPRKIDRFIYELGDLLAVAFLTYLPERELSYIGILNLTSFFQF